MAELTEVSVATGTAALAETALGLLEPYAGRGVVNGGGAAFAGVVSDYLYQFAAFKSEDGAQAGMAIRQLLQAGLEGTQVERSSQPQSEMHVVSGAFGAQLVEKPESLLSERSRIDLRLNLRLIGLQKQFNEQSLLLCNLDL